MAELNGSHVTRAELQATVGPIKEDIREIKEDVKTLIAASVAAAAVQSAQTKIDVRQKDLGARRVAYLAAAISALGSLWWLPSVIH